MAQDQTLTMRFFLKNDENTYVDVRTTVSRRREKLRACRRDILRGTFPRWLPFQNQPYDFRYLDWSVDLPDAPPPEVESVITQPQEPGTAVLAFRAWLTARAIQDGYADIDTLKRLMGAGWGNYLQHSVKLYDDYLVETDPTITLLQARQLRGA